MILRLSIFLVCCISLQAAKVQLPAQAQNIKKITVKLANQQEVTLSPGEFALLKKSSVFVSNQIDDLADFGVHNNDVYMTQVDKTTFTIIITILKLTAADENLSVLSIIQGADISNTALLDLINMTSFLDIAQIQDPAIEAFATRIIEGEMCDTYLENPQFFTNIYSDLKSKMKPYFNNFLFVHFPKKNTILRNIHNIAIPDATTLPDYIFAGLNNDGTLAYFINKQDKLMIFDIKNNKTYTFNTILNGTIRKKISKIIFSYDNKRVAFILDKELNVYEIESQRLLYTMTLDYSPVDMVFDRTGNQIMLSKENTLIKINIKDGKQQEIQVPYRTFYFSPYGRYISAIANNKYFSTIYNLKDFKKVGECQGYCNGSNFNNDETILIDIWHAIRNGAYNLETNIYQLPNFKKITELEIPEGTLSHQARYCYLNTSNNIFLVPGYDYSEINSIDLYNFASEHLASLYILEGIYYWFDNKIMVGKKDEVLVINQNQILTWKLESEYFKSLTFDQIAFLACAFKDDRIPTNPSFEEIRKNLPEGIRPILYSFKHKLNTKLRNAKNKFR